MSKRAAPNDKLILEWVYGYRGNQCHDNLFYNKDGNLVYFAAGVGIIYDRNLKKQQYYFEHDDDINSLAIAPDGDLVATGQIGKEPFICIWSSVNLQTKALLKGGHTHGISSVSFSKDGQHLVSIGSDTNATMNVWNWKQGKILATTRAHSDKVYDARFLQSQDSTLKMVTCGVKHIKFWSLCGNTLTPKKGIFGKVGEIQTMFTVCPNQLDPVTVYAGTANGDIYIWQEHTLTRVLKGAHTGPIYSIQAGNHGYVSGGKDGVIVYYDAEFEIKTKFNARQFSTIGYENLGFRSVCLYDNNIVGGTQNSEIFEMKLDGSSAVPDVLMSGHGAGELWALAAHPIKPIVATGSDDKYLKIWQLQDKECIGSIHVDLAIRSCAFNNDGSLIAIGLNDGSFRIYRSKDLTELFRATNRKEVIHELKFSPNGQWLSVGSNDNFVDFYDVSDGFKRMGVCKGNSSFITHLDWSRDNTYIRTNSGAAEYLIFKAPTGEHVTNTEVLNQIQWAQSTGVLGNEIQGIWEKYTDTNDVNGADVNYQARLIATGDDFGLVKLFKYPCPEKGAHFRKYTGHCAHVTNVRWSSDNRCLISIGGSDQSVFQWKLIPDNNIVHGDSLSEASDSGLSNIGACDSELEKEASVKYERINNKDDINRLQEIEAKKEVKKRKAAPSTGLELEWVHGYRGYDCRNNLYYLQKPNLIVSHVAAVGVITEVGTHRHQKHYLGHTDDILCLALHPTRDFVATGQVGKDPSIHIWDADTLKVLSILKGEHERGICAVDFSRDGKKLASIGLDNNHLIVIWNWRKGEKLASTRGSQDKLFSIRYDPHDHSRLVTVGIRHIRFWSESGNGLQGKRGVFGNIGKADTQLCVVFDSKNAGVCYTGCATGTVYVWKDSTLMRVVQAHSAGGCYAIDALDKGFVTGGKDGMVNLYDERFEKILKSYRIPNGGVNQQQQSGDTNTSCIRSIVLGPEKILVGTSNGDVLEIGPDGRIESVIQGHGEGELWGLAVHPIAYPGQCATVSDDGTASIWQVQSGKHTLLTRKQLKGPARCCGFNYIGTALAVGFKDGSFVVFNPDTFAEIASAHHRKEEISDIKFSPDPGKYLAVGSHDNFVDIYSTMTHQRLSVCKGASSYITHIDWDIHGKLLMVNSGAKEQLFFEAPRGTRQTISRGGIDKLDWATWTCVLGDSCQGIWPPKCDVTDINAASLCNDGVTLATADDFGRVKLFEYPCKTKFAKFKQYAGHSAHVTNVRWLSSDQQNEYLASIGGADTALLIWKHKRQEVSSRDLIGPNIKNVAAGQPQSDLSDTDSEEEHGYDSDVEREKNMDWSSKTYSASDAEIQKQAMIAAKKLQEEAGPSKIKTTISRDISNQSKVQYPVYQLTNQQPPMSGRSRGSKPTSPTSTNDQSKLNTVTKLDLVHVHGYRGCDCRNNLHYLWTQDEQLFIVYHAAAVGIVHNPTTGHQQFYKQHSDDILCLAVNRHPRYRGIVATGELGQSPGIHVWKVGEGQPTAISIIQSSHTQGICSLNFSSTGTLLLSVGVDPEHTIAVTKWEEGTVLASISRQSQRIFLAEFRPDSDTTFVDVGVKHVKFWTVAGNQLVSHHGIIPPTLSDSPDIPPPAHMTTMLSVAFGQNNLSYTGAMNGDVWVWQEYNLIRLVKSVHSGPVFVLHTTLDDGLIVSGGKEKGKDTGSIKLWNQTMTRHKPFYLSENINYRGGITPQGSTKASPLEEKSLEVIRSISRIKGKILVGSQDNDIIDIVEKTGEVKYLLQSHGAGILNSVAQHPTLPQYASASDDGTVKIWDLHTKMLIQSLTTGPATTIDYNHPNGSMLLVGLKIGTFVILSTRSYRLLARQKDRGGCRITQGRWGSGSNGQNMVAIATDLGLVDIYRVHKIVANNSGAANGKGDFSATSSVSSVTGSNYTIKIERLCYIKDLGSPVQHIDFSVDAEWVRLGLVDLNVQIRSTKDGNVIKENENKLIWSSWTSIAGKEMAGIWLETDTKHDAINTAVVSHKATSVVIGDDFGLVKVYPYFPINKDAKPSCIATGHSAHVTDARFINDDSHVITAGGDDCCLFVWQCS